MGISKRDMYFGHEDRWRSLAKETCQRVLEIVKRDIDVVKRDMYFGDEDRWRSLAKEAYKRVHDIVNRNM